MRATLAILRRELGGYLDSAVFWVALFLFVSLLHAVFFFIGIPVGEVRLPSFWAGRVASMDSAFAWLPLFYSLLAPALTMGSWASERRSGTDEILLTQPLRTRDAVLGKFLAAWVLLVFLTAVAVGPLAWVVSQLGPLDWGTVWGGLFGATMLAAVCVSVGLLTSSLVREDLVAFLLASVVLIGLWSLGFLVRLLPAPLAEAAWYASPALHFLESGARGVFDARDVVYHGLFLFAALILNTLLVGARRWRS